MFYTTLVTRTAAFSSLFLTLLMGNSATASLLLSEQLAASVYNSTGTDLPLFSANALLDNDPAIWKSGGNPNPAIEFEFLQPYTVDNFRLVVDQHTDQPAWSELQLSIAPLQQDSADTKATYLASQLLATRDSARGIIRLPNQTVNFRASQFRPDSSVSWVTKVEISIYAALALLALGAVGWNVVHWKQRRQKIKKMARFSSIDESDLLMARLPLGTPPGAWAELESPDPAQSRTNARHSNIT